MRAMNLLNKTLVALFSILIFTMVLPLQAETADSKGRDFFLAFQKSTGNGIGNLSLLITGEQDAVGTIEVPGQSISIPFEVLANTITTIDLPSSIQSLINNQVSNLGVKITSNNEVSIYGLNQKQYTTDAFLALPTDVLGLEYITMGYQGLGGYPSQIAIVAAFDGTEVTVTPSFAATGRAKGVPFTVTLNSGEVFSLESSGDLTGSEIKATTPVAVMSGANCSNVPTNSYACDHLVEMMPPVATWGKAFLTVPLATRRNGDVFRVLASEDNTVININGTEVAVLNRGEYHEIVLTERSEIQTSRPALVAQYSPGQGFDGVISDPFMMLVPPSEQFLDNYTFNTLSQNIGFNTSFVNVVIPTSDIASISLDGSLLDTTLFQPIGQSGFSGAQIPTGEGSHHISSPVPFGIYVYGFGSFDSYGYPGGMAFDFINSRGDVYAPNVKLIPMGDTIEGIAGDSEDLNLNGILDLGEDINANNVLDRRNEDLNNNGILDNGEDTNNNGVIDRDTGVFRVELEAGSDNLKLNLNAFTPGTLQTTFTLSRIDPNLGASGILIVSDGAGNTVKQNIDLSNGPALRNVKVISVLSTNNIDLDNSSFVQTPFSINTVGSETFIEWRFNTITIDQIENLDYEIIFKTPIPDETRLVTNRLELTYIDVNGNAVRKDLGEQSVHVLPSLFDVAVTTDKMVYVANEDVSITALVSNLSAFNASRDLRVSIYDKQGILVEQVGLFPAVSVDANGIKEFPSIVFNTGTLLRGDYVARAELLDDQGNPEAQAETTFAVVHTLGGDPQATLRITVDKPVYNTSDQITLESLSANITKNILIRGATVKIRVLNPDGTVNAEIIQTIGDLAAGNQRLLNSLQSIASAVQGTYSVEAVLMDSDGNLLASDQTLFQVLESLDLTINGSVQVLNKTVSYKGQQSCTNTINNIGTLDLNDAEFRQVLVNIDKGNTENIFAVHPVSTIGFGDSYQFVTEIDISNLDSGQYSCVLQRKEGVDWASIGYDFFELDIKLDTSVDIANSGMRLLVLLDDPNYACLGEDEHDDEDDHDDKKKKDDDDEHDDDNDDDHENNNCQAQLDQEPHGPANAPLLSEQRAALEGLLNQKSWSYTIVTNASDFTRELRSGTYNAYALLSETIKLDEKVQKELREAVFSGEKLLVAGDHDRRNEKLEDALGIDVHGKSATPSSLIVDQVEAYLSTTMDFTLLDKSNSIELAGATQVASYNTDLVCSNDDDDDEDKHHKKSKKKHDDDEDDDHDKKDDDHDDDNECQSSTIAVTHHNYGFGHSVYAGFDLLANAAMPAANTAFSDLLLAALNDLEANSFALNTLAVVPVSINLNNLGIATPGQVTIPQPANTSFIDPGAAILQADGSLLWVFDLPVNEVKTLTFWLQLPDTANNKGTVDISAQVQAGTTPDLLDLETLQLQLPVLSSPSLQSVLDDLLLLKPEDKNFKKAHKKVEKAKKYQGQGKYEKVLKELLKASDYLAKTDHVAVTDVRKKLAFVIREIERQIP